jgi:transcriptional regulator with XRE-family HTH domain
MSEQTENERIGGRMRRAAEAKGIDAEAVATALGVKSETVYRLYQGKITITAARLKRFAALVGQPISSFYEEQQDVEAGQEVAATLVRIFGAMMAGRTPDEAYDLATGSPLWLNPTVREFLRSQADGMRAAIERVGGRPWDAIDGAEKQRVLQEFVRMVLPEEDLGLRRGESDDELRSPWPLPEAEMRDR